MVIESTIEIGFIDHFSVTGVTVQPYPPDKLHQGYDLTTKVVAKSYRWICLAEGMTWAPKPVLIFQTSFKNV